MSRLWTMRRRSSVSTKSFLFETMDAAAVRSVGRILIAILAGQLIQDVRSDFGDDVPSRELVHLFGNEEVPGSYSISSPTITTLDNGTSIFTVDYQNEHYIFSLTPIRLHDEHFDGDPPAACSYTGRGVSHPGATLALVDCTGVKRGMIVKEDGEILFIHPLTPSFEKSPDGDHVVHKRSNDGWAFRTDPIRIQETRNDTCLLDTGDISHSVAAGSYKNRSRLPVLRGSLTVEIALFADEKLWQHFEKIYGSTEAEEELHSFILASVNNINLLYNHPSLDPKIQLKIKRYHVLKNAPALLLDQAHRSGDVDMLLDNFCQYQDSFNPRRDDDPGHWDHALLFTGHDLYRGSLKTVAGYAPVKGMCSGVRSCTINEGLDFGSVFVITHEMGHSLGMFHDGDNGCEAACCIMSPSVGAGKTTWSTCSVQEFNEFLNELGKPEMPPNCLLDGGSEVTGVDYSLHGDYPGQLYNVDQQCRFYHGSCWKQELREGQGEEEVCEMIWCGEGEGVIRTAHPALEGTHCGENKWCFQGKCKPWASSVNPPVPVHGSWSSWNDAPTDGCRLNCDAPCKVEGQIMIRRSVRLCEEPAPNNGGKPCDGAGFRGSVCSEQICQGPRPNEYASRVCTQLRDGAGSANAAVFQLSGRGFQHQEQPCKVWCQLRLGSFARSVGNLPDGTPCGENQFCVKGTCMKRSCGGQSLVLVDGDCPEFGDIPDPAPESPAWSLWSEWSACSATCGGGGRRQRTRTCQGGTCKGRADQLQPCHAPWRCPGGRLGTPIVELTGQGRQEVRHFANSWLPWGEWAQCDVTCGQGLQQRSRTCLANFCAGNSVQSKPCRTGACPFRTGKWNSWEPWSSCGGSCGVGSQQRRRLCRGGASCSGDTSQKRQCQLNPCPVWNPSGQLGAWSVWAQWSSCSRTCGPGGALYRMRSCSTSRCIGSNVSFSKCHLGECPDANSVDAAVLKADQARGRQTP